MKIKSGITRKVLLIFKLAVKIPNISNGHSNFLQGCYANYSERKFCKDFKHADYEENLYKYACPSYLCAWFGLIQIQARCEPNLSDLNEDQIKTYSSLCGTDNKKENFGWYKGRLVCLDYP